MPALRRRCVSIRDLGALQIDDPDHPGREAVAAGAPWFMALFGRDSLLTSWMALPVDQRLALGTLQTLARFQGVKEDPLKEQPGRILHGAVRAGGGHGARRRPGVLRDGGRHPALRRPAR